MNDRNGRPPREIILASMAITGTFGVFMSFAMPSPSTPLAPSLLAQNVFLGLSLAMIYLARKNLL